MAKKVRSSSPRLAVRNREFDFDGLIELGRYASALFLQKPACAQRHLEKLLARGETEATLREVESWRGSSKFSEKERSVLRLCEAYSLNPSEEELGASLAEARKFLDTTQIVRLSLAVVAVNDWVKLHSLHAPKVLVVEDNPFDQELLLLQLRAAELDGNVEFISDGAQALSLLTTDEGRDFRRGLIAIFLDLHLPQVNGIKLLQGIRETPDIEDLPVIVMTSSNDPHDIEECQRLKVAQYVQKPVTFQSFSHAIADIMYACR